jgi:hypothetical protein
LLNQIKLNEAALKKELIRGKVGTVQRVVERESNYFQSQISMASPSSAVES